MHLSHYGEGVNQSKTFKDPYGWGSSTIVNILKEREYLGHTINLKTRKHFKDKKSHYVDENEWVIFENTHAAIIAPETFKNVQRIRSNVKRYPDGWGEAAPLTGLFYCADCGGKMYVHRTNNEVNLTPEELEAQRKKEERKDKLHQAYLRRKTNGTQKRYEDKIKAKKKAEIEAKKAAIHAEDMEKGVFIPASSLPKKEP